MNFLKIAETVLLDRVNTQFDVNSNQFTKLGKNRKDVIWICQYLDTKGHRCNTFAHQAHLNSLSAKLKAHDLYHH